MRGLDSARANPGDYTDETAVNRTIAHWIKVNRATLPDTSDLEQRLRGRLTYGVLYRLER